MDKEAKAMMKLDEPAAEFDEQDFIPISALEHMLTAPVLRPPGRPDQCGDGLG